MIVETVLVLKKSWVCWVGLSTVQYKNQAEGSNMYKKEKLKIINEK